MNTNISENNQSIKDREVKNEKINTVFLGDFLGEFPLEIEKLSNALKKILQYVPQDATLRLMLSSEECSLINSMIASIDIEIEQNNEED